ncbi:MAG: Ig-like domain-containing protein [Coprococcus sp.]|nr:Ig-like domain-containing protein [Coprococcus sp.]
MKNGRTTMIKRFFALVLAFAVAVSILTVPVQESYAAGGKVKTVAVTNLPAKQLTLKKGKSFTLKTKVSVSGKKVSKAVTYKTSNKKVATVNAKGKITAKKKGTATITIYSKADKKKTCKIKVTVGTPVTKVKLNKTKANLNVGKSLTLKTTLSPKKPSNKGIIWKSSNTKVATVTSKGVVKAKKAGTVKITATAKDGSGKKATCKITVKKAASIIPIPTPEEPLIVKSLNIAQPDMLTITLTKQAALTASDFQVWAKKYESADYLKQYTIGQITTTDSLTYKIKLTGDSVLQKNSYIKVVVPKLNLSRECIYRDETYTIEKSETYVYKLGDSVDKSQTLGKGYSNCSVSGLPAGVKYQIKTAAATCTLKFSGNVTKQGKYTSKLVYEDELGNKFSMTIIWLVYDGTELLVKDAEKVLTTAWGTTLPQLAVYGGNGTSTSDYTYELLQEGSDSAALAVSSLINGGAGIQVSSPKLSAGTYKLRIRATDKTDTSMTNTGTLTLKIIEGGYLQGKVKDANGDPLTSFQFTMKNQNEYAEYKDVVSGRWNGVSKDGTILMQDLEAGTYDVTVSSYSGTVSTTVYNLKTQKAAYGTGDVYPVWSFDVTLPVYKVNIELDPDVPDAVKNITNFGNWQDVSAGSYYESGKIVYLENGTHHLTCRKSISGVIYSFYLDVTVNGSNTTAYAYVKE